MFDTTYRIGEPSIQVMPDENGDCHEAHFVAPVLGALPVGPNQLALVQMGILRLPLDKTMIGNLITALGEANAMIKSRPQIQTATSMSEADAIAQMRQLADGNLRG